MLNIQRFVFNFIEVNCYLLWDKTGEAVVIDCGAFSENERQEITSFIRENNLTLRHQLYTHGHFDHIFGAQHIADSYGILPTLHRDEADTYRAAAQQMQAFLHRSLPLSIPPVGTLLSDGEIIKFGTHTLRVISTPGHTAGGVCYYCAEENILLSGDSLFLCSIGRCDLPGGNEATLIAGLQQRILVLPPETKVLPGHGDATTIKNEQQTNPYLQTF
ncbi:MAG: MBL fold metallo-hydrolase [Bacteroidaceae bacterium]|nr:MBL fold metallo-hydrolase [Bacteroidaceae bacterium]